MSGHRKNPAQPSPRLPSQSTAVRACEHASMRACVRACERAWCVCACTHEPACHECLGSGHACQYICRCTPLCACVCFLGSMHTSLCSHLVKETPARSSVRRPAGLRPSRRRGRALLPLKWQLQVQRLALNVSLQAYTSSGSPINCDYRCRRHRRHDLS